jgi:hypothetical protein
MEVDVLHRSLVKPGFGFSQSGEYLDAPPFDAFVQFAILYDLFDIMNASVMVLW